MGKKGLFYTLIGLLLLSYLFAIVFGSFGSNSSLYASSEERLLVVNEFISSLQRDGDFALYAGGLRSMLAMSDYISTNGLFVDDVEYRMHEVFLNGTLYGDLYPIIGNNSLVNWTDNIVQFADDLDITVSIGLGETQVSQSSPWEVLVNHTIVVNVTDKVTGSFWKRNLTLDTQIPIIGISDPLYIIGTSNQYVIYFNQTPYTTFVTGGDVSNLTTHMERNFYAQFSDAPSFLMRFEGDYGAGGDVGIESLIDKDAMDDVVAVTNSLSNADYVYFGGDTPTVYNFTGMPEEFHLDNNTGSEPHISVYDLDDLVE